MQRVQPGQFQESSSGRRVYFIDKDTVEGKEGRNVFISSVDAISSKLRGLEANPLGGMMGYAFAEYVWLEG